MKSLFSSFTALYKKGTEKTSGIYRKKGIRPGTDWKIILITLMFLLLCSAGVHVFIYMGVKNNSWWKAEESSTLYQVKIDKKLLTDALTRFDQQERGLEALRTNPSTLSDPSL